MGELKRALQGAGYLPYKFVHTASCEIMGLQLGQVHLGHYCSKREKIDFIDENFKVYMSLTPETVMPMHVTDVDKYSILSKMYFAIYIADRTFSNSESAVFKKSMFEMYSKNMGVSGTTLKNWQKKYAK